MTRNRLNGVFILSLILLIIILTGCQSHTPPEQKNDDELRIYTSIYPLQFITESIAKEHAHVESIYPPGVDAHTYEPTSREMVAIAKSDMLIYFGHHMESFSESMSKSLTSQNVTQVEIGQYDYLFSNHDEADLDPHIWLDPLRMIDMADIIKEELSLLQPDKAHLFNDNYEVLIEQLRQLDEDFVNTLQHKENKKIVVSHAAYGYWEERYGLEQMTISGISSTDEPSQRELLQIVKLIRKQNIDYIIFDQTGEDRLASIVQEQTNTEKRLIHDLEVLTELDIDHNEDYISLMKKNLDTLNDVTY